MRKVNIHTAQNVVIENILAGSVNRAIASILDLIILGVYYLFCVFIAGAMMVQDFETGFIAFWFLFMPLFLFYSPLCELLFSGRTLGKMIIGIRVVQLNGENIEAEQALMRWVFRVVDLWICFGSLAIIFTSASERGQRIGDTLAETLVVKYKSQEYNINDILKIKNADSLTNKYSGVVQYTDEDMLWLKQLLLRKKKNPNKANKALMDQVALKIQTDLALESLPKNKDKFLTKVLEDYIILTRS